MTALGITDDRHIGPGVDIVVCFVSQRLLNQVQGIVCRSVCHQVGFIKRVSATATVIVRCHYQVTTRGKQVGENVPGVSVSQVTGGGAGGVVQHDHAIPRRELGGQANNGKRDQAGEFIRGRPIWPAGSITDPL